jgi:hypothetical protein
MTIDKLWWAYYLLYWGMQEPPESAQGKIPEACVWLMVAQWILLTFYFIPAPKQGRILH